MANGNGKFNYYNYHCELQSILLFILFDYIAYTYITKLSYNGYMFSAGSI